LDLRGRKGWKTAEDCNEKLYTLYVSPNIFRVIKSRRMRWAVHVARLGTIRNAYSILFGKPEGNRPIGRPRRKWEGNIRIDFREIGFYCVDWNHLFQDRDQWLAVVYTVKLRVP
jgi:hypothetical protein